MDKFVIKTPRAKSKMKRTEKRVKLKQTTIKSLKGVVVIEDIKRAKSLLREPDQDIQVLTEQLKFLLEKQPAIEILQSTKIGKQVKKLCSHPDSSVSDLAMEIVNRWSSHIKHVRTRELLDVRCDAASEKCRQKARQLLLRQIDTQVLVVEIERKIFFGCDRKVRDKYRRTIRHLVTKLSCDEHLRQKFNAGTDLDSLLEHYTTKFV